ILLPPVGEEGLRQRRPLLFPLAGEGYEDLVPQGLSRSWMRAPYFASLRDYLRRLPWWRMFPGRPRWPCRYLPRGFFFATGRAPRGSMGLPPSLSRTSNLSAPVSGLASPRRRSSVSPTA